MKFIIPSTVLFILLLTTDVALAQYLPSNQDPELAERANTIQAGNANFSDNNDLGKYCDNCEVAHLKPQPRQSGNWPVEQRIKSTPNSGADGL